MQRTIAAGSEWWVRLFVLSVAVGIWLRIPWWLGMPIWIGLFALASIARRGTAACRRSRWRRRYVGAGSR